MKPRKYFVITSMIFTLIGILHLVRIIKGYEAQIGSFVIPLWVSWLAVILALILATAGSKLARKMEK
ncbi:MAG: hypothetical protein HYT47_02390 [Candidatus Vogelbacteria bacterium]|nr:hypothetical protein [Candidatus Vogelbacteria bacterium]